MLLDSYRYMIRAWVDVEILLIIFFLVFASTGYGVISGFLMLATLLVAVKSLARLRRM